MDILGIYFSESKNKASVRTDVGYFDITRADLTAFITEFFGRDTACMIVPGADFCDFPLYVSEEGVQRLEFLAEKLKAISYASYILGLGDNSEKKLLFKMKNKGFSPEVSDAALAVLKKNGYLSDDRSCARKCELLASGKLFGRRRIISELMAKGYPYDLCERTVDEAEIDFDENLRLLYEKISKGENLSDWEQKKKLSDKLVRYGYSYDEISSLFDEIVSENFD